MPRLQMKTQIPELDTEFDRAPRREVGKQRMRLVSALDALCNVLETRPSAPLSEALAKVASLAEERGVDLYAEVPPGSPCLIAAVVRAEMALLAPRNVPAWAGKWWRCKCAVRQPPSMARWSWWSRRWAK